MANTIVSSEIWNAQLLSTITPINVAVQLTHEAYTEDVVAGGSKVHVITPGAVSVVDYVKGTDMSLGSITDTDEYIQINKSLAWNFPVDSIDRVQANPNTVATYGQQAGKALSRSVDTYIFSTYSQANSGNKITGASSAALKIAGAAAETSPYELLVDAGVKLTTLDVPLDGRFVVVSPFVLGVLLKDTTRFVRASALGDMVVTSGRFGTKANATPGFVGQIAGFDVYVSANVPSASAGANTYMVFGQGQPISFINQFSTVEAVPNTLQFGQILKGLLLCGAKVFAEDAKRLGSIYVVNSPVAS